MGFLEPADASLRVFVSASAQHTAMVHELTHIVRQAVRLRGRAIVACGGTDSCGAVLHHWAGLSRTTTFWQHVILCEAEQFVVPIGNGVRGASARPWPASDAQTLRMPRTDSAAADAAEYERQLRMALELRPAHPPAFDAMVLELEAEGTLVGQRASSWLAPPSDQLVRVISGGRQRIGLSPPALVASRHMLLVTSPDHAARRVQEWHARHDPHLAPLHRAFAESQTRVTLWVHTPAATP